MVTMVLWDKDHDELVKKAFGGLTSFGDGILGADAEAVKVMVSCMADFEGKSIADAQQLRYASKSKSRLLRQFTNLPVGVARLAALDTWIVNAKKEKHSMELVEGLARQLQSSLSQDLLKSGSAHKIAEHFRKLKKELLGILANAPDELPEQRPEHFNVCADIFAKAAAAIGTAYASKLDEAIAKILKAFATDAQDIQVASLVSKIDEAKKTMPHADEAGITDIGNQSSPGSGLPRRLTGPFGLVHSHFLGCRSVGRALTQEVASGDSGELFFVVSPPV